MKMGCRSNALISVCSLSCTAARPGPASASELNSETPQVLLPSLEQDAQSALLFLLLHIIIIITAFSTHASFCHLASFFFLFLSPYNTFFGKNQTKSYSTSELFTISCCIRLRSLCEKICRKNISPQTGHDQELLKKSCFSIFADPKIDPIH